MKHIADLTLTELASQHDQCRGVVAACTAELNRLSAVSKLVAGRMARHPHEKVRDAIAALRLKKDHIPPSALLPADIELIDRSGLLARARNKFGVRRSGTWLHNTLKDRDGPSPIACDNGVWFYEKAAAEAWLDSLLSQLRRGRLPRDEDLIRRRQAERERERAEWDRQWAEKQRRFAAATGLERVLMSATDPAIAYAEAVSYAIGQAIDAKITEAARPPAAGAKVLPFFHGVKVNFANKKPPEDAA